MVGAMGLVHDSCDYNVRCRRGSEEMMEGIIGDDG